MGCVVCGQSTLPLNNPARAIFVLSAHAQEDSVPQALAQVCDDKPSQSSAWGAIGKLTAAVPASWLLLGSSGERASKGGLCTQSLLYVLRGGLAQTRDGARDGSLALADLLRAMHYVVAKNGFPEAVITVRSSVDICRGPSRPTVAEAIPRMLRGWPPPPHRALLIGICYRDTPGWALEGSWNDVHDVRRWLTSELGWPASSVRTLTDEPGTGDPPTRQSMLEHLMWLLGDDDEDEDAAAADGVGPCRLLHFCGHGDEGRVFPLDWQEAGSLEATALSDLVAERLRRGHIFTCLLDCCESSTLFTGLDYGLQLPEPDGGMRQLA